LLTSYEELTQPVMEKTRFLRFWTGYPGGAHPQDGLYRRIA